MARAIGIDAEDVEKAKTFGIFITNFAQASNNKIVVLDGSCSIAPLELHFGGSNNFVELRSECLPHGTIRFFGEDAVFTMEGEAQHCRIDVYSHTGSRVTIEKPKAIHGLKAIAYNASNIFIGPGCLIAENTLIMTSDHHSIIDLDTGRQLNHPADVRLDGDVWLGWASSVLKGVTIGRGSIVGAHAVVTSDIGAAELWAGVPARKMKRRVSWVASHPANGFDVDQMMKNFEEPDRGIPSRRIEPAASISAQLGVMRRHQGDDFRSSDTVGAIAASGRVGPMEPGREPDV